MPWIIEDATWVASNLIPHDVITENMTLAQLANQYAASP